MTDYSDVDIDIEIDDAANDGGIDEDSAVSNISERERSRQQTERRRNIEDRLEELRLKADLGLYDDTYN